MPQLSKHKMHPDKRRQRRYNELTQGEQNKLLWKAITALAEGNPLPNDVRAMMEKRQRIKEKIPK